MLRVRLWLHSEGLIIKYTRQGHPIRFNIVKGDRGIEIHFPKVFEYLVHEQSCATCRLLHAEDLERDRYLEACNDHNPRTREAIATQSRFDTDVNKRPSMYALLWGPLRQETWKQ